MKICYVITKADEIGGAQIHVKDLCIRLQNEGHIPVVIVGENGALVKLLTAQNITVKILNSLVREISPIKDIICTWQLRKLIKQLKPDLVSLHSSKAGIIGRLALVGSNIPVIFTAHGWSFANGIAEKKRKLYILIERIFAHLTDKIITVSKQDKLLAIKHRVADKQKQVIIHNGMPLPIVAPDYTMRQQHTVIRLISVARFSEQKDHKTLLLALSQCHIKNWVLDLVGKGKMESELKKLVAELKLENKVNFLGERSDVEMLLNCSDIFLLISNWEGFPRSILEAMRAGLPVIASDVGGVRESVRDNHTGFIVRRGDVTQLAEKLDQLMGSSEKRECFGRQGEAIFFNAFTFETMYRKTKHEYKALINSR